MKKLIECLCLEGFLLEILINNRCKLQVCDLERSPTGQEIFSSEEWGRISWLHRFCSAYYGKTLGSWFTVRRWSSFRTFFICILKCHKSWAESLFLLNCLLESILSNPTRMCWYVAGIHNSFKLNDVLFSLFHLLCVLGCADNKRWRIMNSLSTLLAKDEKDFLMKTLIWGEVS